MKCKYCGTELPKETNFCPNCGKDLSKLRKCFKCGEIIDDDATFCPHCGVEQPVYDEGDTSKKWIWAVAALFLIAAIAGGYYYQSNRHDDANITADSQPDSTWTDTISTDTVAPEKKEVEEIPFERILDAMKYEVNNVLEEEEDENNLSHTLKSLGYIYKTRKHESVDPNENALTYYFYKGCELNNNFTPINIIKEEACIIKEYFVETHAYPIFMSIHVFLPENLKLIEQTLSSQQIEYDKSYIDEGWEVTISTDNLMETDNDESENSYEDMGM